MAEVVVCSQTNSKHINTVRTERIIIKIFNLLVHPVTSRLCIMATARLKSEEQHTTKPLSRPTSNTSLEEQTIAYNLYRAS
jgi:hypothetical protein